MNRPLLEQIYKICKCQDGYSQCFCLRGAEAESFLVALWGLDSTSHIPAARYRDQALSVSIFWSFLFSANHTLVLRKIMSDIGIRLCNSEKAAVVDSIECFI